MNQCSHAHGCLPPGVSMWSSAGSVELAEVLTVWLVGVHYLVHVVLSGAIHNILHIRIT